MVEVKTEPLECILATDDIIKSPPGSIKFYDSALFKPAGFTFMCPCGCKTLGGVRVAGEYAWKWNKNKEKPTISPSIALSNHDGPHWHGYLEEGVWKSC